MAGNQPELFPELSFESVKDGALQGILERHYSQAKAAYEASSWGGAIVLLGSVAEGLLASSLLQPGIKEEAIDYHRHKYAKNDRRRDQPIPEWYLPELIEAAVKVELVSTQAKEAAWAIKDFRNYIHPCQLLSVSTRLDQAIALSCLGGLLRIADSLRGRSQ